LSARRNERARSVESLLTFDQDPWRDIRRVDGTAQTKSVGRTTAGMSRLDLRNEKVRAVAEHEPVSVTSSATLDQALAEMRRGGGDALLVMDDGRLAGILTERDVLTRILGQNVDGTQPVSEFMTRDPHSLSADAPLLEAMATMESGHYRNLPLIDDSGQVVGMLRQQDLLGYVAEAFPEEILNLPPRPHQTMEAPEGA
jgi:CBS domain-containing protein